MPREPCRGSEPRAAWLARAPWPGRRTARKWQKLGLFFSLLDLSLGGKDEGVSARAVPIFFWLSFNNLVSHGGDRGNLRAPAWGVTETSCTCSVRSSGGGPEALFHRARLDSTARNDAPDLTS